MALPVVEPVTGSGALEAPADVLAVRAVAAADGDAVTMTAVAGATGNDTRRRCLAGSGMPDASTE